MLGSLEHDSPSYDDSQLEAMLGEARSRSALLGRRRRRQRRSAAGAAALVAAVVIAVTSVGVLGNGGGAPARVVAAPAWKTVSNISQPSWQVVLPDGYQPGVGLTCPTALTCYLDHFSDAGGQQVRIEATHDGGNTWRDLSLPAEVSWLGRGLSCLDGDNCVALGKDAAGDYLIVRTSDGGASWSTQQLSSIPSSANLYGVSCGSASSCVAVGASSDLATSFALVTSDGGQSWTPSPLPDNFVPLRVECGAGRRCLASGYWRQSSNGAVLYSTDGGSTWTAAQLPAGISAVTSISCGDASHCLAITMGSESSSTSASVVDVSSILATTDGGVSWLRASGDIAPSLLTSLSCVTASYCWTSGVEVSSSAGPTAGQSATSPSATGLPSGNGFLATTDDAGASWRSADLPHGFSSVAAVACPDATNCYAVGFARLPGSNGASGPTGPSGGGPSGPDANLPGSFVFLLLMPASR